MGLNRIVSPFRKFRADSLPGTKTDRPFSPDVGGGSSTCGKFRYDSVMTQPRFLYVRFTLAIACGIAGTAWAQAPEERRAPWPAGGDGQAAHDGFDDNGPGSRNMAADAVRRAQAESRGRVLGAERVQFDGRDIMRVKVMDQSGRVRYMDDDPSNRNYPRGGAGTERNDMGAPRPRGPNPSRP